MAVLRFIVPNTATLREPPQDPYILPVVALIFGRSFEDKGLGFQGGMGEDAAEAGFSDVALADVFVAVEARAKGAFGIVGVDDVDEVQGEGLVGGGAMSKPAASRWQVSRQNPRGRSVSRAARS